MSTFLSTLRLVSCRLKASMGVSLLTIHPAKDKKYHGRDKMGLHKACFVISRSPVRSRRVAPLTLLKSVDYPLPPAVARGSPPLQLESGW